MVGLVATVEYKEKSYLVIQGKKSSRGSNPQKTSIFWTFDILTPAPPGKTNQAMEHHHF